MLIRPTFKAFIIVALKLILGAAAAAAVLLNGATFGGCPPGTYCLVDLEFYSMQLDLWSGLMTLVALLLLLSAFKKKGAECRRKDPAPLSIEHISQM